MSRAGREALWERLLGAGLVTGEIPAGAGGAPWFVRAMLGIAGWIGALFMLGFVGAGFAFVMRSGVASMAVGAATCAVAAAIMIRKPGADFPAQFGLAMSIAGQGMLAWGLADLLGHRLGAAALAVGAVQAALFMLVPGYVHRVWTSLTAALALAAALWDWRLHPYVPALVTAAFARFWLAELDYPRRGELIRAGGHGLALAVLLTAVLHGGVRASWLVGAGRTAGARVWIGAALSGLVLVWVVLRMLKREGVSPASGPGGVALAAACVPALASLEVPGLAAATTILLVGYGAGERVVTGLGIVGLLGYLSHYYYAMEATLLRKSALLASAGVLLLLARLALDRWWPHRAEEVRDA